MFNMLPLPVLLASMMILLLEVSSCPLECLCSFDEEVRCQNAMLDKLPEDLSSEVGFLDLSYNQFMAIPQDISLFPGLKKLIFSHNRITTLSGSLLKELDFLKALDLSWNRLASIDISTRSLATLQSLTQLDLSHNPLKSIPKCTTPTLEHLNVVNASITVLSSNVLSPFPNLKTLNISKNVLPEITGQFKSATLIKLDLSDCGIEKVALNALNGLKSLTSLYLTRNYQLKGFSANSTSLEYLNLIDCNLDRVPRSWLPNLTTLELSKNHIRRLEPGLFYSMPKVKQLSLGDNAMEYVSKDSFDQAFYLESLDMSRNTFKNLDVNIFKGKDRLKMVNLSRTYINSMIPFQAQGVSRLDLSNCEINQIDWNALKGMPKLQFLYLTGNLIREIPINLTSQSLIVLDLSNNRLSSIKNSTFRLLPNLQHVDLVGNRLVTMEFYYSFNNIRSFFIGDNPWRCECQHKPFEIFYKKLNQLNTDIENARCQTPQALEGKPWGEACANEWFPWNFAQGDRAWMVSIGLMTVFILSCCCFVTVNRELTRRKKRQREEEVERRAEVQQRLMAMVRQAREIQHEPSHNAPDPRDLQGPPSYNEAITMPPLGSTTSLYSRKEDPLGSSIFNASINTINTVTTINNNLNLSRNNLNIVNSSSGGSDVKQKVRRKKRVKSPHMTNRLSAASQESTVMGSSDAQSSNQISYQRSTSHASEMSQSNPDLLDKSGRPLSAKTRRRRKRSQTRSQTLAESSSDADTSVIETNM